MSETSEDSWVLEPEELIPEVKCHPIIYDQSHLEYNNKELKFAAWLQITRKLSKDLSKKDEYNRCKEIQTRWKHLRDCFRREYYLMKNLREGHNVKRKKKYRYYDVLTFLIPHLKESASTSFEKKEPKRRVAKSVSPESSNGDDSEENPLAFNDEASTSASVHIPVTPTQNFENVSNAIRIDDYLHSDEDRAFCLSLVQSLKRLNDSDKISVKIDILNIIRGYTVEHKI